MPKRTDHIEALLKLWPILAFVVMMIGSYFTVKLNMKSHDDAIRAIRESQSKIWERITDTRERVSRLEGSR